MADTPNTTAEQTQGQPHSPDGSPRTARGRKAFAILLLLVAGGVSTWALWPRESAPEVDAPALTTHTTAAPANNNFGDDESRKNLDEALQISHRILERLKQVSDYTGKLTKQERYKGTLLPEEVMAVKIREEPFSVYIRHLSPSSKDGQEAIYVEGQNDGKLVAHAVGAGAYLGTLKLAPTGWLAMMDNLHPITDIGLRNLVRQLLDMADKKRDYFLKCKITIIEDGELNGRPCRILDLRSPRPAADFRMAIARIYFDKEWEVPVRYEAFDFPPGHDHGEPILMERYTWSDLKFNVGLTDLDFDPANPEYDYPK
jgi:hypothetical protein